MRKSITAYALALIFSAGAANADIGLNVRLGISGNPFAAKSALSAPEQGDQIVAQLARLNTRLEALRIPIDLAPVISGKQSVDATVQTIDQFYSRLPKDVGRIVLTPALRAQGSTNVAALAQKDAKTAWENLLHALGTWAADKPAVMLELLNEPVACEADEGQWYSLQQDAYQSLRQSFPTLKIVVTGACWGTAKYLLELDLQPYAADSSVYFTFHYYEPATFTKQDVPWKKNFTRYTQGLSLFPGCLDAAAASTAFQARLDGDAVADAKRQQLLKQFDRSVQGLAKVNWASRTTKTFSKIKQHFTEAGIAPERIFLGEFGVFSGTDEYPRAPTSDRLFWVQTVRDAAASSGFLWTYWAAVGIAGIWPDWASTEEDTALVDVLDGRSRVAAPACAK